MDCSHVPVSSPGGEHAEIFRNRKGYFSINVQALADYRLKFQDIVARWHGSAHDSNIFDHSRLRARTEAGHFRDSVLLGDGGYACRLYLLTPYRDPENAHEAAFNRAHIKTRSTVERMFGVWKRRFPVLKMGIRNKLPTAKIIIIATAVLHNMAIDAGNPMPRMMPRMRHHYPRVPVRRHREPVRRGPTAVRAEITNGFF